MGNRNGNVATEAKCRLQICSSQLCVTRAKYRKLALAESRFAEIGQVKWCLEATAIPVHRFGIT